MRCCISWNIPIVYHFNLLRLERTSRVTDDFLVLWKILFVGLLFPLQIRRVLVVFRLMGMKIRSVDKIELACLYG